MNSRIRLILLAIGCALAMGGAVLWLVDRGLSSGLLIAAAVSAGAALLVRPEPARRVSRLEEPDQIGSLDEARHRELVRGTSLHLRDMKYRYSVRIDATGRDCFTAVVNQIRLGFLPVVITDNYTDRQGLGYVAFPYDGRRWRGPGLPCVGDREDALQHAARCVEPLGDLEDTRE